VNQGPLPYQGVEPVCQVAIVTLWPAAQRRGALLTALHLPALALAL
jgi:hypothetical protein